MKIFKFVGILTAFAIARDLPTEGEVEYSSNIILCYLEGLKFGMRMLKV